MYGPDEWCADRLLLGAHFKERITAVNVPPLFQNDEDRTEFVPDLRDSPLSRLRNDPDGATAEAVHRALSGMERETHVPVASSSFNSFI
jgi:hypothetical protein